MSKIICDMCGTSYPDTADQCPICGCVRPVDAHAVNPDEENRDAAPGYTHVKGGRFSKSNVKKRNKGRPQEPMPDFKRNDDMPHNNLGMIVLICLVFLAVIAVAAFIVIRFFLPNDSGNGTVVKPSTEAVDPTVIPCTGIVLEDKTTFTITSDAYQLSVYPEPADTTEALVFASDNEEIAIVDQNGKITPVGTGCAVITITCGEYTVECTIYCEADGAQSTDPTEETTEATEETVAVEELRLNRKDITMVMQGEKWKLYDGTIPVEDITWSSDDEKVATIQNGVVEAVGKGNTEVHAEYGDQKVSCIVRCSFESTSGGLTGGGVGEDGGGGDAGTYSICAYGSPMTDITIYGQESNMSFRDADNNVITVTWESTDTSVFTVSSSGGSCTIKPVATGVAKLKVTYKGQDYYCIVRVAGV